MNVSWPCSVHGRVRVTVFPRLHTLNNCLHESSSKVRPELVSLRSLAVVKSQFNTPVASSCSQSPMSLRSIVIVSVDDCVLSASLECLSITSALEDVVVSLAREAAAKDVPRLERARITTSAKRLM